MCMHALYSGDEKHGVFHAGYDILVWKWMLCRNGIDGVIVSPFQGVPMKFDDTQRACFGIEKVMYAEFHFFVGKGLHAYFDKDSAIQNFIPNHEEFLFPAIIPKGAHFILGTRGEVVSTALRILRTVPAEAQLTGNFALHTKLRDLP